MFQAELEACERLEKADFTVDASTFSFSKETDESTIIFDPNNKVFTIF